MRRCPKCQKIFEEDFFNWKIRNIKRAVYCKKCSRNYIREHYQKNLDYYIQKARKRNLKIKRTGESYIAKYLKSHPCVDCGESDILVLEFDHRKNIEKETEISSSLKKFNSLVKLKQEIAKCDVRCANCHRKKTAFEQKSWKLKFAPVA